ncbi:hypothetical protein AB0O91_36605 [Kitasatospora sp. NPDC089797]|uniref:hypothetical protein n=1 Tax=Kitasatospora sp. NPDC089797 TaxID=3155298 RepID=UPI0034120ADA
MHYTPDTGDLLPPIVTICGSTRFSQHMAEAAPEETAAGRMVLAPGVDMRQQHPIWADPAAADLAVAEHGSSASLVDVRRAARATLGADLPYDRAQAALATRTEDTSTTAFLLGDA